MRVAFVVPRYGAEVGGGAEEQCRGSRAARGRRRVHRLTSCALDYRSWADHYPPGESRDGDVRVLRFRVAGRATVPSFDRVSAEAFARPEDVALGRRFMREQGPDVPGIREHLLAGRDATTPSASRRTCTRRPRTRSSPSPTAPCCSTARARRAAAAARGLRRRLAGAARDRLQHARGARAARGALRPRRAAALRHRPLGRRAPAGRSGALPGALRRRGPLPARARPRRAGEGRRTRARALPGAAHAPATTSRSCWSAAATWSCRTSTGSSRPGSSTSRRSTTRSRARRSCSCRRRTRASRSPRSRPGATAGRRSRTAPRRCSSGRRGGPGGGLWFDDPRSSTPPSRCSSTRRRSPRRSACRAGATCEPARRGRGARGLARGARLAAGAVAAD